MFLDDKNLKDSHRELVKDNSSMPAPHEMTGLNLGSFSKTKKLITALYMVTDILEKDEPIRLRLRTLGAEIISDMYSSFLKMEGRINEIMSFLEIAATLGMISEMNVGILRNEFQALRRSILESGRGFGTGGDKIKITDLREFFAEDDGEDPQEFLEVTPPVYPARKPIGHTPTRLGMQKAGNLMKALSSVSASDRGPSVKDNFDLLKKQRRDAIIKVAKDSPAGATITDIKFKGQAPISDTGEKTLQRELISMVKDGVLKKTGEKRWSRYFIAG